jgi:hypothetical protein
MSATIQIRPLQPSDAQAYQALRLEALRTSPEAFGSSYEEEAPLALETIRARMPSTDPNAIFGAFAGKDLVGVAGFFQLPTSLMPREAPSSISVRRERPRHMTMLPGGGSLARAR